MNKEKWLLALISFVISLNTESISTLGDNLLMNHDFSLPNILPLGVRQKTFAHSIPGWNCSSYCEIVNCDLNNLALQKLNNNMFSGDCPSQALDTSSLNIDVISQSFEAQAGEHTLDIKFLSPTTLARYKILVVIVNQQIVYKYHPLSQDFSHKQVSVTISLNERYNSISFTSEGINDRAGFRIFDVKIRRKIFPQVTKAIEMTTNNVILSNMVAIPCSRILFGELINTIISVDRLQLYYYHHRKYSYYYNIFLRGIFDLLNQKGTYATYISDAFFSSISTSEQQIFQSINYKNGRKYKDGYDKNNFMQNGGFFFVISYIPIALIIFFIFRALFSLTFNNKFSKILRKYSFLSLIVLMLFEGNIEQFSFLIMDEFLEFFSVCFGHRILNLVIVTIAYTFDRGMVCLVLGSVHRLTLLCGKDQLLILVAVQLLLLTPKLAFLQSTSYKCKVMAWLNSVEAVIRIVFILSIYSYEDLADARQMINESVHLRVICFFLIVWILNLLLTVITALVENLHQTQSKSLQKHSKSRKVFSSKSNSLDFFQYRKKITFSKNNESKQKNTDRTSTLMIPRPISI